MVGGRLIACFRALPATAKVLRPFAELLRQHQDAELTF